MSKLFSGLSKLFTKKKLILFTLTFLFGLFVYSLLITERLTNSYDGIWWSGFYIAGTWEISCGRFVWPFLHLFRAFLSQDPYMSVISLFVIALALLIFDETLKIEKIWQALLANCMFMANVVVCVFLSYRFMSPTFAFAFLFAILAVRFLFGLKRYLNIFAAGICMMLCMGLYQATIGCTCVLLLTTLTLLLFRGEEIHKVLLHLLEGFLAAVFGAILYIVLLNLSLKILNLPMTSYNGADTYSIWGTIIHLPASCVRAYEAFVLYFFKNQYHVTVYSKYYTFTSISILAMIGVLICVIFRFTKDRWKGLLSLLFLLLMPAASNAVLFVATGAGNEIQMTAPMALVYPSLLILFLVTAEQITGKLWKTTALILTVGIGCIFTWLETLQVCWDQNVMLESTSTTKWIFEATVDDLRAENLLDNERTYIYIGRPVNNSMYKKSRMFDQANSYAKVGNFFSGPGNTSRSWAGVNNNLVGVNMNIGDAATYEEVIGNSTIMEQINAIPAFPEEGYIREIGNYTFVKISEYK